MGNCFTILDLPERLQLDPDEVDDAWREATKQHHPDGSTEAADGEHSTELNRARSVLSDPVQRLEHWLDLRQPAAAPDQAIDPSLMDLFSDIHSTLETTDDVLSRHRAATTDLGRALLAREAVEAQLAVQDCLRRVQELESSVVERFGEFETSAEQHAFDDALAGLGQLKFLRKWKQQCQDRLLGLLEC